MAAEKRPSTSQIRIKYSQEVKAQGVHSWSGSSNLPILFGFIIMLRDGEVVSYGAHIPLS